MWIPLARPYLPEKVWERVCDVLDSGWLTEGLVTEEFERLAKEYKEKSGNLLSIAGLYQFLTKKGYAVVSVDPIEVPITI